MTTGENIKRIRKEKGLTQKQLGERLNMTQSAIGQFENDKTSPKIETIDKIASALGVNIVDIYREGEKLSTEEEFTFEDFMILEELWKSSKLTKREKLAVRRLYRTYQFMVD